MPLIRHRRRSHVEQGDCSVEVGKDAYEVTWHLQTLLRWRNKRERTQAPGACHFNHFVLANTSGHHKAARRWTWHSPNRQHHKQTDHNLVRKLLVRGLFLTLPRLSWTISLTISGYQKLSHLQIVAQNWSLPAEREREVLCRTVCAFLYIFLKFIFVCLFSFCFV